MKKLTISMMLLMVVTGCVVTSADSPDRVYRSYKVFGGSIDKLLLETPHVYVRVNNETDFYYLPQIGLVYYTNISLTLSAGLPKIVEQWSDWFSGSSGSSIVINKEKNGEHSIRIQRNATSDDAADDQPGNESNDDEMESSRSEEKSNKLKDMQQADEARLQKMAESIDAFKLEVTELILDFASIIKTRTADDSLIIVFRVADIQYFEKYGTNSLVVQIPFKVISDLAGKNAKDSSVRKAFHWNI